MMEAITAWWKKVTDGGERPQSRVPSLPLQDYLPFELLAPPWPAKNALAAIKAQTERGTDPDSADELEKKSDFLMLKAHGTRLLGVPAFAGGFRLRETYIFDAISRAVQLTPKTETELLHRRETKRNTFLELRFVFQGDTADLAAAIKSAEKIVDGMPSDHPGALSRLTNLANLYAHWFEQLGFYENIDKAIEHAATAVGLAEARLKGDGDDEDPDSVVILAATRQSLAMKCFLRHRATGSLGDLEYAISLSGRALDTFPAKYPQRAICLGEQSGMLASRFRRTKDVEFLDQAIATMEEAVKATSKLDPAMSMSLRDLSKYYLDRYVTAIVSAAEKASGPNQANDPFGLPDLLGLLGICDLRQYESREMKNDFKKATSNSLSALFANFGDGSQHPNRAILHLTIANAYLSGYKKTGAMTYAAAAESYAKKATHELPEDHPVLAEAMECLGDAKVARWLFIGSESSHLRTALETYMEGVKVTNGHPLTRMRMLKKAGTICIREEIWEGAAYAFRSAIGLWRWLNPRTLSMTDLEFLLADFCGLGDLTAYCTLKYPAPYAQGLLDLEFGRGMIASVAIDSRMDMSFVRDQDPELYARYMKARSAVYPSLVRSTELSFAPAELLATETSRRNRLAVDLLEVEDEIGKMDGFFNLQGLASVERITSLAPDRNSAIVYFHLTRYVSRVYLVSGGKIDSFRLAHIKYDDVLAHVNSLIRGRDLIDGPARTKEARNKQVHAILAWLWTRVVKPILLKLNLFSETPPAEKLPRLWWVTSGLMGLLPLHAAGTDWGDQSSENTASQVVSSYVPSLKSLRYARSKKVSFTGGERELLLVAMKQTPGRKDLAVDAERRGIAAKLALPNVKLDSLNTPTRQEALGRIPAASMVHFICHGASQARSPSSSCLFLRDGEPLTVRDLAALTAADDANHAPQLAYLSACSTAENRATTLADESLHIANAFHLVGFPHVLSTLWPADDRIARDVAPLFYGYLSARVRRGEDSGDDAVARALHDAVGNLLKKGKRLRDNPIGWATFIHIGA